MSNTLTLNQKLKDYFSSFPKKSNTIKSLLQKKHAKTCADILRAKKQQSFLITGNRACAKTSLAIIIAMLNAKHGDGNVLYVCHSQRTVIDMMHYLFHYVNLSGTSDDWEFSKHEHFAMCKSSKKSIIFTYDDEVLRVGYKWRFDGRINICFFDDIEDIEYEAIRCLVNKSPYCRKIVYIGHFVSTSEIDKLKHFILNNSKCYVFTLNDIPVRYVGKHFFDGMKLSKEYRNQVKGLSKKEIIKGLFE